jgi:anti-anti-sigma factor
MTIKEEKRGKTAVLTIEGKIDSATSAQLEKKLLTMIENDGEKNIVLDFSNMNYISSAGLRVLLMAAKRAGKLDGKVGLACLNANVKEVFDIAGFSNIFDIYTSLDEALKAFDL